MEFKYYDNQLFDGTPQFFFSFYPYLPTSVCHQWQTKSNLLTLECDLHPLHLLEEYEECEIGDSMTFHKGIWNYNNCDLFQRRVLVQGPLTHEQVATQRMVAMVKELVDSDETNLHNNSIVCLKFNHQYFLMIENLHHCTFREWIQLNHSEPIPDYLIQQLLALLLIHNWLGVQLTGHLFDHIVVRCHVKSGSLNPPIYMLYCIGEYQVNPILRATDRSECHSFQEYQHKWIPVDDRWNVRCQDMILYHSLWVCREFRQWKINLQHFDQLIHCSL